MPKIELFIPSAIFDITEIEDILRITFPDDCPYRDQFFYFSKAKGQNLNQPAGWKLKTDGSALIVILNLRKNRYEQIQWEFLTIQIERYLKERCNNETDQIEHCE